MGIQVPMALHSIRMYSGRMKRSISNTALEGSILTDRSSPSPSRNALSTMFALDRSEFTLGQSEPAHRPVRCEAGI